MNSQKLDKYQRVHLRKGSNVDLTSLELNAENHTSQPISDPTQPENKDGASTNQVCACVWCQDFFFVPSGNMFPQNFFHLSWLDLFRARVVCRIGSAGSGVIVCLHFIILEGKWITGTGVTTNLPGRLPCNSVQAASFPPFTSSSGACTFTFPCLASMVL